MSPQRCSNCRFYDGDHCRRRAPLPRHAWHFSLIAMLQAIARAQLKIAQAPDGIFGTGADADDMVFEEVTEQYEPDRWAEVRARDWCGEWEEDDERFGSFSTGGLRKTEEELEEEH